MRKLLSLAFISVFLINSTMANTISMEEKVKMFKESDIEKVTEFLTPETSDLIKQYHEDLNSDFSNQIPQHTTMNTTIVSLALFVAARSYGNHIRGSGNPKPEQVKPLDDNLFDLSEAVLNEY